MPGTGGTVRIIVTVAALLAGTALAQAAGALAVGACGAYGSSYDYSSVAEARRSALAKCQGAGCRIVTNVRRSCAALSVDGSKPCGPFGYAVAPRLGRAENNALRQCYKYGGRSCVIRAWLCDAKG